MVLLTNIAVPVDNNMNTIDASWNDILTRRMAYNASGNIVYLGQAPAASLSASAVWQVRRFQYDTATYDNISNVMFASGTILFDQVWDSRASLTYL